MTHRNYTNWILASVASLPLVVIGATPAWAQSSTQTDLSQEEYDAAQPGAAEQTQSRPSTEDPTAIVVTAQRRSSQLLRTATPVTALTADSLVRQGANKIVDYAATVPGLGMVSSQPGQTVVMIRGIGTGHGSAIPSTVATYIDDVPYGSSTASAYGSIGTLDLDPGTLQRIEVLRGPQGTLYGASALGGLVKYVTRKPSLYDLRGRFELSGTSVSHGSIGAGARGMLDGPLVEGKVGATVSGFYRKDPGVVDDPFRNKDNINTYEVYGGRASLYFTPVDDFSAQFTAVLQNSHSPSTSEVDLDADLIPIYGKYSQVRTNNENWDFKVRLYTLNADYDLGWASLASITSYAERNAHWDIDMTNKFGPRVGELLGVSNVGLFDNVTLNHTKRTQEVRLTSPDSDSFEWLAGFFYTHESSSKPEAFSETYDATTLEPLPAAYPPEGLFQTVINDKYTEYAGYADATVHLGPKFSILGGLRYTKSTENSLVPTSGFLAGGASTITGHASSATWTYLLTPSFEIDDNHMVYARYATGFRPGGPTNLSEGLIGLGAPAEYQPDALDNFEVGYKGQIPSARLTLDLSAFYLDWKGIQLLTQVNGFNVTGNAGRARSKGFEFAATWTPLPGLNIAANGAYTDAYMTVDTPRIGAQAGDQLPNTPKFSAYLSADYDFQISDAVDGFFGASYQHVGSRPVDYVSGTPDGYVRPAMEAYDLISLRAGVNFEGFSIEAYVRNLGDAYAFTRLRSQRRNGIDAPWAGALLQPRTFGLTITSQF